MQLAAIIRLQCQTDFNIVCGSDTIRHGCLIVSQTGKCLNFGNESGSIIFSQFGISGTFII